MTTRIRKEMVDRAVRFLRNPKVAGPIEWKIAFLSEKGLTGEEILIAIDEATGGEIQKTSKRFLD